MKNRVLILGFGISGQAAARLARDLGKTPLPVDVRTVPWDGEALFNWTPGTALPEAPLAVISPGISIHSPMAQAARDAGAEVIGELEFAVRALDRPFAAITGTNGKTTTTELTAALFRANGIRAEAAGNIGNALSDAVLQIRKRNDLDFLILETSSFQLESIAGSFAPSTAAFLNLASDHINRHGSLEGYRKAKERIFCNRKGTAVIRADLLASVDVGKGPVLTFSSTDTNADFHLSSGSFRFRNTPVLARADLKLPGLHNAENLMAALAILYAEAGEKALFSAETAEAVRSFAPDAHRMELFAEAGGVRFFDDSKATNPHSVNAFLRTFGGQKNVVLILGGLDKEMDFSSIRDDADKSKCAFLIGECRDKIFRELSNTFPCTLCSSLDEATEQGFHAAAPGDLLALSPACASMDQFRDYKERGLRFQTAIRALIEHAPATSGNAR